MKLTSLIPASVALFVLLALPRIAFACPSCAGTEEGGPGRIAMLGAMILLPFCIFGGIVYVLRATQPESALGSALDAGETAGGNAGEPPAPTGAKG